MGVRNYSPRGTLHLTRRLWMDGRQTLPYKLSHYGVTGSMRWSWVRLSLFEEL